MFLGGWFGGASVSLVVEERQRLIGEREINKFLYYLFCSLYYFIKLYLNIETGMLEKL